MSTKKVQEGKIITITASGAITVNSIVRVGALVGVALKTVATGEKVAVAIGEVRNVPKAAVTVTQGDTLDWDDSAGNFTNNLGVAATGDIERAAVAFEDAATGAAEVAALLTPGGTLTP